MKNIILLGFLGILTVTGIHTPVEIGPSSFEEAKISTYISEYEALLYDFKKWKEITNNRTKFLLKLAMEPCSNQLD